MGGQQSKIYKPVHKHDLVDHFRLTGSVSGKPSTKSDMVPKKLEKNELVPQFLSYTTFEYK